MIKHKDGSISELPKIKLHSKQQSSLLDCESMTVDECKMLSKIIDNYIEE